MKKIFPKGFHHPKKYNYIPVAPDKDVDHEATMGTRKGAWRALINGLVFPIPGFKTKKSAMKAGWRMMRVEVK